MNSSNKMKGTKMKRLIFTPVLTIAFLFFLTNTLNFAQSRPLRYSEQHNSKFAKDHLEKTVRTLVKSLTDDVVDSKLTAVRTIRQLEEMFPEEPFDSFVDPLIKIIQNEKSETQLRVLSALALDDLHSDKGDQVILEVAKNCSDESLKNVCTALSYVSLKDEQIE
jgi:Mg2+ and Co2+ transporter CorA